MGELPAPSAQQDRARQPQHSGVRRADRFATYGWLGLLSLLVICAALVAIARTHASTLDLAVAAERMSGPAFTDGLYAMERNPDGGTYRWTGGSVVVQLRGAASVAPAFLLIVRLHAENPAGPQPLAFITDGRLLATTTPATSFRTYRLLLPVAADGELRLNLRTPTFVAHSNPRALGVVLTDLRLRPLPTYDWVGATVTALGLLSLSLSLRRAGASLRHTLVAVALAGLGLVTVAAIYRPAPLPFAALAALFLAAALAAVALGGWQFEGLPTHLGLIALALIVSFSGMIWPSWLSDDAFISFRYAQNLAAGNGLVYNIGERVEGYTNFLWTIVAAGVLALGGDIVTWSYVSGVGLGLAILLLTYMVAARLRGSAWGLVAALVVGTSQSLLLYTARGAGLETGLFTLLALIGSFGYLAARGRPAMLVAAGAALALAAMTRPEGVLVFAITVAHLMLLGLPDDERRMTNDKRRTEALTRDPLTPRSPWSAVGGRWPSVLWLLMSFLLIFLPYYLWRLGYYGDPLPNTFYAKTGGGLRQVLRGLEYAGGFFLTLGGPLLLLALLPWLRGWRAALRSWRGYLLLLAIIYSSYIVFVGGDHFRGERFFVPVLPWLAILLADGFAAALPPRPGRLAPALLALLLFFGGVAALARSLAIDETISGVDESVWIWREIGWWVADHAPPDASLAALGAGAVAYYSQHPVIDLLGLTEKHIARIAVADMGEGTAGHEKRDPAYVLHDRRPTYIPQIWDDYFGGAAGLRDHYRLISIVTRSGRAMRLWERLP